MISTLNGFRAILRTTSTPRRSAIVERGASLRVGRSDRADLVIPNDAQMSAVHYAVEWDGERGKVRDLDSAKGTWLGGARITEAPLANGAWIRAGGTDFLVHFEGHSPALPRDAPLLLGRRLQKDAALNRLRGRREQLYAVVDASTGPRALQLIQEAVDHHESLYDGLKGDCLASEAPYLVQLRDDSGLLDRLVREGWGRRWGIYLSCNRPFRDVRRHLRRFLLVQDDVTLEKSYLRYFDPRVLRLLLPASTPRQLHDLFGDVAAFVAEGEDGETLCFERPNGGQFEGRP